MSDQGSHRRADVAVIGLGSAGERLANTLARAGLQVVGFEPALVGGECPFLACMPSKSLLHDAHRRNGIREANAADDWRDAIARRDRVVHHRDDRDHATELLDRGVQVIRESARICRARVVGTDTQRWEVDHVVLATGSEPVIPPIEGLARARVWTFADALRSEDLPSRLAIVGAGAVGCELADIYHSFGADVTLLEREDRLLPGFDDEVAEQYLDRLRSSGLDVRLSARVVRVEHRPDSTVLHTADGAPLEVDQLVVAVGKRPRLHDLGLETVGLGDGEVPALDNTFVVDGHPWLSLIGDVNQRAPWTHGANREADVVADRILGRATSVSEGHERMAHGVFTHPAVAHVGRSAADHGASGRQARRGVGRYRDIARATTDELGDGMAVIAVDADTGVIVGGSVVGASADELISVVAAWVQFEVTIDQARRQVFPFPTIGQVLEVAVSDPRAIRD